MKILCRYIIILLIVCCLGNISRGQSRDKGDYAPPVAATVANFPMALKGTSSIFYMNGTYWTANDHGDLIIYNIDSTTGEILRVIPFDIEIEDMEEIAQDADYIYFGDFGDNLGERDNLRIFRLDKGDIASGIFDFDTIEFWYPERNRWNRRNYDCESFVVGDSNFYLFTKRWNSLDCEVYSIPKRIGEWRANLLGSFASDGLVTGCCYLPQFQLLTLCGYNTSCKPFVIIIYDIEGENFLDAKKLHVELGNEQGVQTEAIISHDGIHYYLTNEYLALVSSYTPPRLLNLDLSPFLEDYVNGTGEVHRLAIAEKPRQQLGVFPNPTTRWLNISGAEGCKITIYNMRGQCVGEAFDQQRLDLSSLPSGCYTLVATAPDGTMRRTTIAKQ